MHWNDEHIIFANLYIFSENHLPYEIHVRDTQIKEIAIFIRPITENRKPVNCWLHSKSGIGKTSTARWILRKLDSESVNELYHSKLW